MRDLTRDLVERQSRDQTKYPFWYAECCRHQVGIAERREVCKPVQPTPESFQNPSIPHCVERARVDSATNSLHRAEHAATLPKDALRPGERVLVLRLLAHG